VLPDKAAVVVASSGCVWVPGATAELVTVEHVFVEEARRGRSTTWRSTSRVLCFRAKSSQYSSV
jgi:hypothetical protein